MSEIKCDTCKHRKCLFSNELMKAYCFIFKFELGFNQNVRNKAWQFWRKLKWTECDCYEEKVVETRDAKIKAAIAKVFKRDDPQLADKTEPSPAGKPGVIKHPMMGK